MKQNSLFDRINDQPNKYISTGLVILTIGISLNMLISAVIKPALVDSLDQVGIVIGYILNASTAFLALFGLVVVTNALTAKKEAKQNKVVRRKKKNK